MVINNVFWKFTGHAAKHPIELTVTITVCSSLDHKEMRILEAPSSSTLFTSLLLRIEFLLTFMTRVTPTRI